MGELRRGFDVLVFAVISDAALALESVFFTQFGGIEIQVRKKIVQSFAFGGHQTPRLAIDNLHAAL